MGERATRNDPAVASPKPAPAPTRWLADPEHDARLRALRYPEGSLVATLERRIEYLQREYNLMRRAMQAAGTWDQFCQDYAAYKDGRFDG